MKWLLLKGFLLIGIAVGYAQSPPFYFTHYQVENGLSNNAILCSVQDSNGFMWFGTKDGLNRFDGYSFKVFHSAPHNPNGLGSNFVRALLADQAGQIWVGTDQGIYLFDPTTENFSLFHPSIVNEALDIQGDAQGHIWFIDDHVLYRYTTDTDSLCPVTDRSDFLVTAFGLDRAGTVWMGTIDGYLYAYSPASGLSQPYSLFNQSPQVVSQWIERVFCADDGHLLIGTSKQGVKVFHPADGTYEDLLTHDDEGSDLFVRDILENGRGEYWLATESGIIIYNLRDRISTYLKKQRSNPWALSDNAVYTLCKDKENSIWAGTYFGGVNHYAVANTFFEKFFPLSGSTTIAGNAIREICADKHGNLWIGTEDEGLNRLETATGTITNFQPTGSPQGLSHANIHGLLASGDTLWVGTFEHGLDLLDIRTGKVIRHYHSENKEGSLQNNFIFNIYRTRNGRILLATGKGLYEYLSGSDQFRLVPDFPGHIFYTTLFEDSEGTIWAGTWRDGLYYSNPKAKRKGSFVHLAADSGSLASNRVNRIFEDSRGNLWVATEGGLNRFDPLRRNFGRYGTAQGLPSNLILALLEDDDGKLWVTTSRGLVRFDCTTGVVNVFTRANGLLSDQFNYNSAYRAPDGTMYFGSVKGLIRFNPAQYRENDYEPPVYITAMQVYNRELEINKKGSPLTRSITFTNRVELNYNQSSFSIDFAALGFVSPVMTEYTYKMEGLDKEWTHIRTNRRVYFTELPPGDYTFRVNVADSGGNFKGKETQLQITIRPPFWASWPAYVLYTVVFVTALWYAVKSYHRRVRERNKRKLELIRHRKEEELYRAKMDFFTNVAHEIRTPLTLIKAPLEKVMKRADDLPTMKRHLQTMERNTARLLELTEQLLDFRKTEVSGYRLNFAPVDIGALLRENYLSFKLAAEQKRIRIRLNVPPSPCVAYIDREAVTQIISNLLTNAVKYAERVIYLELSEHTPQDMLFTITVKNDGYLIPMDMGEKIFDTFVRLPATKAKQGTGLGLALARSLTLLHNGELFLSPPQEGLNVFTLRLPFKQEHNAHGTRINENGKGLPAGSG